MTKTAQEMVAEAKERVPGITCQELQQLTDEERPHTLIDVREPDEWEAGHIEGAVHIPRGVLEFKIEKLVPDKDSLVIVQCASGGRAALCGAVLQEMGYANVKNLEGGYNEYCKKIEA